MRIGLVSPYSFAVPGGVQNHVLGLAGWLARAGHDVEILGPGTPVRVPDGVRATSAGGALAWRHNGSVARIAVGARAQRQLGAWLRRGRFDVVHVHEPLTPGLGTGALLQATSPVVATFHSAGGDPRWHRLSGRVLRPALGRIGAAVAVSPAAAALAQVAMGVPVRVIPNAIDVDAFPLGSPGNPWRGGETPRVVFLGRDEPRKGLNVFLAAADAIRAAHPGVDLVVASPGRRGLPDGVRLVSSPDDDARNALLAGADAYVAAHTGRESFGIVLLEALACGTAVVASDLAPFRAVLGEESDSVRFFRPGSPEALARQVHLALQRPPAPAAARALAERYDWGRVAPQLEAVYDELLGASSRIA